MSVYKPIPMDKITRDNAAQKKSELCMPKEGGAERQEYELRYPNGRKIFYSVLGASDLKRVVFYSHGFPASRIEASVAHRVAQQLGLTVIALDRPGFGRSEWYPFRRFEDWAEDVSLVADHHEIPRFSILGVSGGTPTAVAAAALLSSRVSSLTIVSGISPIKSSSDLVGMNTVNRFFLTMGRKLPCMAKGIVWCLAQLWRTYPRVVMLWFGMLLPKADRRLVSQREVGVILATNIKEALSQGVRGAVSEFMLLISDWNSLLSKIAVPTAIWHGDADTYVPVAMGENLHRSIPGSTFHKVVDGGHFMILDTMSEVLAGLR